MADAPSYTPGYTETAVRFMARRTAETHARFFLPLLRAGMNVLDCGCGPGGISVGLARTVAPGRLIGVDAADSQVLAAEARAAAEGLTNARFLAANATALPFPDASFDAAFSHALFEHLPDPVAAARELLRVLRPGGMVGVRSPDWSGFLLAPIDPEADAALADYRRVQEAAGGDTRAGRKLGAVLSAAGFTEVRLEAEYENYTDRGVIVEYLAQRLEGANPPAAAALRTWSRQAGGLFAQAWVSAVGRKVSGENNEPVTRGRG